ncbi:MAG: redoxin domain-containing protein [Bacteroidota bacterium]|nr:redoxin domain-containing protein [Bacteroidota bacterium]
MRKKNFIVGAIILVGFFIFNPFQKASAQTIPPFQLQLTNGNAYSYKNVLKTKPLLIIYFAPDCEHCQVLIREVIKKISSFKKAQLLLVSFEPLNMVKTFEKDYHLLNYSNIKCGTEIPTFYFKNLFNLQKTPFTALYNRDGRLIVSYKDETPVNDLIKHLNAL